MLKIMPIILAAGDSSRMGRFPKALLPLQETTFLAHIFNVLSMAGLPGSFVVLGTHEPKIRPVAAEYLTRILVNPRPDRGQFSSLHLALTHMDTSYDGCLVWPVDQPLVSADLVRNLVRLFERAATDLVLPRHPSGKSGHPAIFGPGLIADLLALPAEANPKEIIRSYKHSAVWLETDEAGAFQDIDTPDDYLRLVGESLDAAIRRTSGMEHDF